MSTDVLKPRIELSGNTRHPWWCHGRGGAGYGTSQKDAYDNWLLNLSDAEERKYFEEIKASDGEITRPRSTENRSDLAVSWEWLRWVRVYAS